MILRGREHTVETAYRTGAAALLVAIGSIVAALAFEHLGGMVPCPLCLMQRWAYYVGIPVLFVALVLFTAEWSLAAKILFYAVALAFLANAGLGIYHAGAEWQFWPGPDTCAGSGTVPGSAGDMLKNLQNPVSVVRCDQAAGRLFGLSFAGWNVVASLAIALATMHAARQAAAR